MLVQAVTIEDFTFEALLRDWGHLFIEHHAEIAANQEELPFVVDDLRFLAMEEKDDLLVVAALSIEGEVLGYSVNIVSSTLTAADSLVCSNAGIYVVPSHRGRGLGVRIMDAVEKRAARRGCAAVQMHGSTTPAGGQLVRIATSRGYRPTEVVLTKVLKET